MTSSKLFKSGIILFLALLFLIAFNSSQAEPAKFDTPVRFAVIGDRTGGAVDSVYEEVVAEICRLRPDFVMSPGDCIEGYTADENENREQWKTFREIIKPFGNNFHVSPGNHDIWSDSAEKIYREMMGEPYFSIDLRGIHFVMLDAGRWELGSEMPAEQRQWLEEDLKTHRGAACTMVFLHKPAWYNTVSMGRQGVLHDLFKKYGVDAVFTGHYHEYFSGTYDGIMYTGIGSSGAELSEAASQLDYQYAWVTVDNDGIHIAPIKKESVCDWNETTDIDQHKYDQIYMLGLVAGDAVLVGADLKVSPAEISIIADDTYSQYDLNDTLRWNVPDNWRIEPQSMPVMAKAGERAQVSFKAECTGELFPLPSVGTNFVLKEGRYVPAQTYLRVSRTASCNHVDTSPTIDGHITEECWKNAEDKYFDPEGKAMTTDPLNIFFAYDKDNLYIAAFCAEMRMDSLVANATEHDGAVYAEDCVGFFFEPVPGSDTVYQIYFGASGGIYDQKIARDKYGWMQADRGWNGEYEIKTVKADKFWSLEARIPVNQFNTLMEKGKDWNLNFRRKQKHLETAADWQVPLGSEPQTMGVLKMQ